MTRLTDTATPRIDHSRPGEFNMARDDTAKPLESLGFTSSNFFSSFFDCG
jgi:hypothetical protein